MKRKENDYLLTNEWKTLKTYEPKFSSVWKIEKTHLAFPLTVHVTMSSSRSPPPPPSPLGATVGAEGQQDKDTRWTTSVDQCTKVPLKTGKYCFQETVTQQIVFSIYILSEKIEYSIKSMKLPAQESGLLISFICISVNEMNGAVDGRTYCLWHCLTWAIWWSGEEDAQTSTVQRLNPWACCQTLRWFLLVHEDVRACRHFLDDEGIDPMNLPPSSPHLNPTQHLLHMFLYLRVSSLSSAMVQTWEQMIRTPSGIWNMSGLAYTQHMEAI